VNNEAENQERDVSAYPYAPLGSALRIAEAVKECGGARNEVSKGVLAHHLGETEKAPGFGQRISAARSFGLIVGRSDYTLTDIAKRIFFPINETDKSHAMLAALASPPTFGKIIARFDGDKLPKKEIVANVLHREYGLPESWKDRVATFFINSVQAVGAIDQQGILRYSVTLKSTVKPEPPDNRPELPDPNNTSQSFTDFAEQYMQAVVGKAGISGIPTHSHVLPLGLDNKRKVTVIAPLDLTEKEVKRILKWLEVTLVIEPETI
jgi:hypothetical protein